MTNREHHIMHAQETSTMGKKKKKGQKMALTDSWTILTKDSKEEFSCLLFGFLLDNL